MFKQQAIDDRASSAKEAKKLQDSIAEKDRALKAINTALSDTPENVLKKLKTLKKQKTDESNARKQADKVIIGLRKEKQELEQKLKEMQVQLDELAPADTAEAEE
jgi:colicin import membrane protein